MGSEGAVGADRGGARWAYPLVPMLAVLVAGSLAVDESGVRFPVVAVGVVGATAALAVLVMRRTSGFVLAVSEGFLWTIALASARALYTPAKWMTFIWIFFSIGVGTVMAYLHAATVRDRFVRTTMRIFATLGAVAIAASTVVAARTRSIVDGDLSFLQQVPVERWSSSSTTNCAAVEARGKCAFVVEHACVEGSPPGAPPEPPSPVWRYARLLTLAAMLPAAVWTVARVGLALFP